MMAKERFVKQAVPIPIHDSLASFFENWTSEDKRMGSGTKIDDFPHSKSGNRTSRAPKKYTIFQKPPLPSYSELE
jgi:hypothetical protein